MNWTNAKEMRAFFHVSVRSFGRECAFEHLCIWDSLIKEDGLGRVSCDKMAGPFLFGMLLQLQGLA